MMEIMNILPVLTVLIGALALMFLSMYDRFSIKNHIIVSTLFLLLALAFSIYPAGESFSLLPYSEYLYDLLIFDTYANFFNMALI
ncbi:MAG: NADH-quinone oxidoreductase subunit N, partial [Deltaproteobacteria bacterium HGW-Deltaproteobacteria-24]